MFHLERGSIAVARLTVTSFRSPLFGDAEWLALGAWSNGDMIGGPNTSPSWRVVLGGAAGRSRKSCRRTAKPSNDGAYDRNGQSQ